jgi:hypothetical protein
MGQLVAVTEKPTTRPGVVRFEVNRTLTGMGHERYRSIDEAVGVKPAAVLARRLFETGQVAAVHVYANIITVEVREGGDPGGLDEIVRDLYQYWKPGMAPPAFEDLTVAEEVAPASSGTPAGEAGDAALSEAAKRVPAHLLERSRQARERWKAKQAG